MIDPISHRVIRLQMDSTPLYLDERARVNLIRSSPKSRTSNITT